LTFSKEDFQIIRALNGVEAIAKAKESKPDIILLDIFMPEKNGYEVRELLRKDPQLKEVPIIFLVAAFEDFDKERTLRSGADDYVTKPFESKQLIAKVKQHLFARTARLASESEEAKVEGPEVKVEFALREEAPPPRTTVEITPPAGILRPAAFVTELMAEPGPASEKEEEPSFDLEAEILTPSIPVLGPEAPSPAAEAEKEEAPFPSALEEAETGVSDEELWQMLDLSGAEVPPLPSPQKTEEAELTMVSEDSAEAFFDLYSKESAVEATPEPTPEVRFESLVEPKFGEEVVAEGAEGKEEEEIISFDNLQDAVLGEDLTLLSQEAGPSLELEETEVEEDILLPFRTGEVLPVEEAMDLSEDVGVSEGMAVSEGVELSESVDFGESVEVGKGPEISPDRILSDKVTGDVADRIVREVSDRLVSRIEKIIWEVVPDLAEVLISKEIERIKTAVEEQETS
jgi:CheY-like chemotaxis protein